MKINILFIINNLLFGGTEKQLMELINNIDRKKFRPFLCTLRSSPEIYNDLNITKIQLNIKSLINPNIFYEISRIINFTKKNKIHVVQTFFQDPVVVGTVLKLLLKIKLFGAFRDLGFWRTPLVSLKMRLCYPFFDGFIANSFAVQKYYVEYDKIPDEKIHVIYNGFRNQKYKKLETTIFDNSKNQNIVGLVATLDRPVKRLQDFISVAPFVLSVLPNTKFVVIGDGYLKDELVRQSKKLGVEESIIFFGSVKNPQSHISLFDIGVITSESEGLSNSIIEYMAAGIPVVATKTGGNPEIINDGLNGYLVPVGNITEMANRIIEILRNPEAAMKMGSNNRNKIKNEFSIQKFIRNHENYYLSFYNTSN
jgi:glycosyltransferase involved in cell wall biosynthesis